MVSYRVRRIVMFSAVLALTSFSISPRTLQAQAPRVAENQSANRDWTGEVPAHLSIVDGQVTLERDGKLEPAEANVPLLAGDRLRTSDGRVEIVYADGTTLAVDKETDVDLLSGELIRLRDGRLRLTISRTTEELEYRIDASAGSVFINSAGEFRVETGADKNGDATVDLMVVRGSAELFNDHGRTLVRAGRRATTTATTEPSLPYAANAAAADDFVRWSDDQYDARTGTVSAEYLPDEVDYYSGVFDTSGTWGYEPAYGGRVWYPRVYPGWRPYSQGRWSFSVYFGWNWVGIDRWAWPTHHYGRWGVSANRWYWVPGNVWAPAWVSWGYAPGYVSWCPVGFAGSGYYGYPWYATTVVPVRHFTHNVWVTQHAVAYDTIAPETQRAFVARATAPIAEGGAIPRRDLAPLRAPTSAKRTAALTGQRQVAAGGPFDTARTKSVANSAAARGPVTSTIIGTPVRAKESPAQTLGKVGALAGQASSPNRAPASTAPPRDAKPSVSQIEVLRGTPVDRVAVPSTGAKRYEPARTEPSKYEPPAGPASSGEISRSARPRPTDPGRYTPPPAASAKSRGQSAERYAPPPTPSAPPSYGSKSSGPAAAPPSSAPAPSRSGKVSPPSGGPPRSAAPPPSSAPPPSPRSGKVDAPPAAAPPPARSGGTTTGSGKGRGGR